MNENTTANLTGMKQAKCTACEHVFSTVNNFDRHLVRHKNEDGSTVRVTCQNPANVGLVRNKSGIWVQPANEDAVSRLDAMRKKAR